MSVNCASTEAINNNNLSNEDSNLVASLAPSSRLAIDDIVESSVYKKRKYTINVRPSSDLKFLKVLIPFDLDLKKFYLAPEELEIYDVKDYIQSTIDRFNKKAEFHIHVDYESSGFCRIVSWFVFILAQLICLYLTLCLWTMTFFNVVFLAILIRITISSHRKIGEKFRNISNKARLLKIKLILEKENKTDYCRYRKYIWILGDIGYWLEMRKEL